ncbi:PAS domain S-box-containing protein/diguanylate cyclase (GGDEF) domain-containing protein [Lentibacillus halodurans]|uniref:PAS domain S-box-containing protein/diguanylate cyclase (GGDEF) domain-containing protein n=1 Tax=Lentibacillus halodurans TaxID=237679 RepID=A0A1I1AFJ5_9BACI|nr:EAL domain-containing protein [Lentibacillus halodurans]SFB35268.1 PAS domain S-box-containing protein/diguanylate cyclase (GGDEF) domain-containing protein [Lentibacillus halodurans]
MFKEINLPINDQILTRLKDAIVFVRQNGEVIRGNDAAYALLKMDDENEKSIYEYLDFRLLQENDETHLLMELKNQNGKLIEVKAIRTGKDIYCLIISELSITDKTDELKRHINNQVYNNSEGIVMYEGNRIIDCDQTFSDMFGYTEEEIKNMDISQLIDDRGFHQLPDIHLYPERPYELTGVRKDSSTFYFEIMGLPYNNHGNIIRVAVIKDITNRIENEKRIEYMAYYDELTDLPHWNFFNKVLKEAVNEAEKNQQMLAVYFIDLNYFKEINDTFGYAFGDKLLRACGDRFKTFLNTNTFIARMSGDEFLILYRCPKDQDAVAAFAEKLMTAFEKPIKMNDYEIFTSISIGISIYPENGTSANDLIKHADSAMYVIKEKHGSNYNIFELSIAENFKAMLTMERELRKALMEGQFELHYQPQKSLDSNKIVGVEALLRWKHPLKSYIPPDKFIGLAEKTGLIIDIGDWVLKEACRQNKTWQDKGFQPVIVSVNLSAKQFYQKGLVEKVEHILNETGLAPKYLELEITETMAMTNEENILETMHCLRKLGVFVSIDDFGTGYSSFKYLSVFPITKLKIDKMFINENREQNQAIVKSIIHMSHSLDMKVIAEGVETIEQLKFLTEEKCDEMQGFYFSKPLPPEKLTKLLQTVG